MSGESVAIVLVRPARPANVAGACRAMKNMGLGVLRIVEAPEGLERPDVRALAYGAWDVLDAARRVASLAEAVAGATLVVGTSARSSAEAWTPRRLAEEGARRAGGGQLALVFGPEATGLRNDELALCHLRVVIPTDPAQPSLNLAQAVLVLAYELFLTSGQAAPPTVERRATAGEVESALASLREALLAIGYLNASNPDAILAELRGLIARAGPTPREVTLLRGIARQMLWAASRIARGRGAGG